MAARLEIRGGGGGGRIGGNTEKARLAAASSRYARRSVSHKEYRLIKLNLAVDGA
jgi:hypothetical protein